jgi:DNA-binding CsgD family transcriptional regulator
MAKPRQIKSIILELRREGKSYSEICKIVNCSKNTVHYHCKKNNLTDIGMKNHEVSAEVANDIINFCKDNTNLKASENFGLSLSTIKKYKKPIIVK